MGQPNNERQEYRSACTFCVAFNRGSQKIKVQEEYKYVVKFRYSVWEGIATYADNSIGEVKPKLRRHLHIGLHVILRPPWVLGSLGEGSFMFRELSTVVREQAPSKHTTLTQH